jgi:hypothetical protein
LLHFKLQKVPLKAGDILHSQTVAIPFSGTYRGPQSNASSMSEKPIQPGDPLQKQIMGALFTENKDLTLAMEMFRGAIRAY